MKVGQIQGLNFGIYDHSSTRTVGDTTVKKIVGYTNGKKISIYSQYENNTLTGKLYYLEDKFMNFLKFKLLSIENGKVKKLVKIGKKLDKQF